MKVILLKEFKNLGQAGQIKEVSPNYARNVLFKSKIAQLATPENLHKIKELNDKHAKNQQARVDHEKKLAKQLSGVKLNIKASANKQGKLFAGLDAQQIIEALKTQAKLELESKQIKIKESIKNTGIYKVDFTISKVLSGQFSLEVKPN